jgi:N-acetylglucosaminyldiphosphoundecaprenol N-acetyl-beta-D-mannosaminyltransferase
MATPNKNADDSINLFGSRMHSWTMAQTVSEVGRRLTESGFTQHVVVNVAKLVNMQSDTELKAAVMACDIINIDGMGVVLGGRFLGERIPERVAGIDLFHRLLKYAEGSRHSVFFLGAKAPVVQDAVNILRKQYPRLNIAGFHHGYFWDDEAAVVEKIRQSGASMLFVAITSPKKEQFINRWREKLGVKFAMGVGGTFDVVAGVTRRAPLWMQKTGLEWLYRVLQEPRRMWKRYLVTNTIFAGLLLKEKCRMIFSKK